MRVLPILIITTAVVLFSGCKKFLDEKRNKSSVIPAKLADCQALLDYYQYMNVRDAASGEISADDYYMTDEIFNSLKADNYGRMYLWEKSDIYPASNDWDFLYQSIYYANTVLETLGDIERTQKNKDEWDNIKGQALVFRARSFLQAVWQWSPAFDEMTSDYDLGIPLRLSTDFNKKTKRANVRDSYNQIIKDLKESVPLLPVKASYLTRPGKNVAFGYLARTYLSMRDYKNARIYADSSLQISSQLLDYNSLNTSAKFPFTSLNQEVVFESRTGYIGPLLQSTSRIDSVFYDSYAMNDLRKQLYFVKNANNTFSFKGSYEGGLPLFSGLTTAEMLLIRSEASAKLGAVSNALNDLNTLLEKRWKTGTYVKPQIPNSDEAVKLIRQERRKELTMRLLRWADIKRMNKEGAGIVLKRYINGKYHTLAPNDKKYALPIPEDVITITGIQQN